MVFFPIQRSFDERIPKYGTPDSVWLLLPFFARFSDNTVNYGFPYTGGSQMNPNHGPLLKIFYHATDNFLITLIFYYFSTPFLFLIRKQYILT